VGKSRLALELARASAGEGAFRVRFVELAAIRNAGFVAQTIAEALDVSDATLLDLPRRARALCDGTPTLLMLDNFEQVLDAAPLVADLLTEVAALKVLTTSRAPLRVRGEREYAVGPLALNANLDVTSPADLARAPAVRLFVERVRDVQPDFRLTPANGPAVTEICHKLDALPLALELAAPWIKVLTVDDLLRRLTGDVLLSTAGPRDLPERQQTMNATVAWSYQLLAPDEQRVFRRLGALPGRFPIEAAEAVLAGGNVASVTKDDALRAGAGLIDKSLLLRAESSLATRPLYRMLETVRAFAALELTAAGERDDALEGLARYCIDEARLAAPGLVGPAQVEWLDRVREDLESYRTALRWLIKHGRSMEASDTAWGLLFFWLIRGSGVEGLHWYEQILSLRALPPAAESRTLLGAGAMWYAQKELGRARTALTRALPLAHAAGDMATVAEAEQLLGYIDLAVGDNTAARARFVRSLERFQALAIPWGTGSTLNGLARAALAADDAGEAERLLDEATSVLRHAGPMFLSLALYVRAILELRRGNADEAIKAVRESLAHIRELHDKFAFVHSLIPLAAAAALKGDDAWAARILAAQDIVTERTGTTVNDRSGNDLKQRVKREVRARLGPDRWAQAYAAGRTTSIDSLINDIDSVLKSRPDG
jgi:predicted ATPase